MKKDKPFFIIVLNEKLAEVDRRDYISENIEITNSYEYEVHNEWKLEYDVIYKSYTDE